MTSDNLSGDTQVAPDGTQTAERAAAAPRQTPRSRERRAMLIKGAHRVFERDGFMDARITDIAREVGMAHGSFYTYFDSKEAIFREVATEIQTEMFDGAPSVERSDLTPYQRIEAANRRYLESYSRHARIMAIIENVATFNDEVLLIRQQRAQRSISRTEHAIRRWQEDGAADPEVDAHLAAVALTSMVSRFAYLWFGVNSGPEYQFDVDNAVDGLTRLWANAIGVRKE